MASKKINGLIIKVYNSLISSRLINKNNKVCRRVRAALLHNICYKCEASFGKANPERVFYVIRSGQSEMGFFGLYNYVVDGIIDAVALGAEPVVDWRYYPNDYLCDDVQPCKKNAWEVFFEPLSGVSLDEVYRSKNVIMSSSEYKDGGKVAYEYEHPEAMKKTSELIGKYIILRKDIENIISERANILGISERAVLGVKLRGTDFKETKPKFHCICPDVEYTSKTIEKIEEKKGRFDKIYLVTEDNKMYEEMYELYGERIISIDEERIESANGQWLNKMYDGKDADFKYMSMRDYLVSVYLLAKCDAIISPLVGALNGAARICGDRSKINILSLGLYE